jgi:NADH-quinone oxidoreductase subunit D
MTARRPPEARVHRRQAADARLNVELETEGMTLNIGPQHPATHGTLRIIVRLDGEQVVAAEPIAGYMHRGYEKLTEVRTYPQVTTLINRIDWLGSFANEVPFILAAEKLMEVEAPPRAQWIRTILFELSAASPTSSCSSATWACSSAPITPVFYAFRDREYVLNQIEAATGGRFHPNFDRIGGLKDDLPKGWITETKGRWRSCATSATRSKRCCSATRSSRAALRGIGVIPADVAKQYGLSGANLRVSGVDWDLRRDQAMPLAYDKIDWKVWTHPDGDSFARFWVRLQETREATKIVDQLLRRHAQRADHGQGAAHHQGARRRSLGEHREPARRDGLLRRQQGRPGPVPGEDPLGQLQQRVDRAVGAARASTSPTSSRSSRRSTSSWETSTDDQSPSISPTGSRRCCGFWVARWPCCCRPAPSCTCTCSRS